MKKIFIVAMALAAFVSCSKDDEDVALTSGKKAIAIEILNAKNATRASLDAGNTVAGEEKPCAKFDELQVLFANNTGVIIENYKLNAGEEVTVANQDGKSYMFHGVDQSVTQVAVARWSSSDNITIKNGETNISTLLELATNLEKNANRAIENIALYGVDNSLTETTETHTGSPVTGNAHAKEETTYKVYTAEIEVAPRFARVEISSISCTDLGDENKNGVADLVTGYDEMVLGNFSFTKDGHTYTLNAINGNKWYGTHKYVTGKDTDGNKIWAVTPADKVVRESKPATGVWSWNVKEDSDWAEMNLALTVDAADYKVQVQNRNLKIANLEYNGDETDPTTHGFTETTVDNGKKYYLDTYKKNHIYQLSIPFSEKNLDKVNEDMCVKVKVTIVDWVVVPVKPVFGNN